ncbi:hypothetical protein RDI58_005027 [Solanum bulbocastanum]|uniref:Uncharacterized protein n=1 Tax=Solanum bulbocastanum TaxID=147425 RepID=A0AAN8TZN1_SOLBU
MIRRISFFLSQRGVGNQSSISPANMGIISLDAYVKDSVMKKRIFFVSGDKSFELIDISNNGDRWFTIVKIQH